MSPPQRCGLVRPIGSVLPDSQRGLSCTVADNLGRVSLHRLVRLENMNLDIWNL